MRRSPSSRCHLRLLAAVLLLLTVPGHAAEGGFSATLPADTQMAAGLAGLTPAERAALDQLVAAELAAVRRADGPELTGTFVSRRTEAERKSAGLDRLTSAQVEKLNEVVASALTPRPKPKERPRLKESDVLSAARENRIHGSVTVAYGWGGRGRDLWAESLWLEYYDPESRVGLSLGLTNFNGDGFYGYFPDDYGGGYYHSLPLCFGTTCRGNPRDDFHFGEGQSFRGGGAFLLRGGRRGHY